MHAVINLAGAPIDRRWTDAYKRELVESRIMTTRKLVEAVNRLHEPPGVMISASAVGYYGSSGGCHGELDAPEADSFLAELCVAWEKEAGLVNSSVRLVLTRFGVVLSPDGGARPERVRIIFFPGWLWKIWRMPWSSLWAGSIFPARSM